MCLPTSRLGSRNLARLRTAGCSTQESCGLRWLASVLKPPASQPGVSTPRSSESRSLPRPGRCVRSGGSAWLILRLVLRGQLLTTPWTFSTASRLASAQSIAGSLSTCLWPLWSWASVLSWRPCALHSVLAMNRLSWTSFHACLRTVHCYWLVR